MADYVLTPAPLLTGVDLTAADRRMSAVTDRVLTSLAIPQGGEADATAALAASPGMPMPDPGQSAAAGDNRVIRLAPDQLLMVTPAPAPAALTGPFYTTDQTGGWVIVQLEGPGCDAVLERLSMLDTGRFPVDAAQRTLIAHLSVVLVRLDMERWWLMSAASSARSFAHAVETALIAVA